MEINTNINGLLETKMVRSPVPFIYVTDSKMTPAIRGMLLVGRLTNIIDFPS